MQAHGRVRLDIGVRSHPALLAVPRVLTANEAGTRHGTNGLQHPILLVAQPVDAAANRRIHGQVGNDLQQMVLDHVANRAHLFIESPATFHAERLGHRNTHAADVVAVPEGLEESVREAKVEQILDRFLAES